MMSTEARPPDGLAVATRLREVADELKRASSTCTSVAWAYGVGATTVGMSDETGGRLFDLASLTKPLFTAPALLVSLGSDPRVERPLGARIAGRHVDHLPTFAQVLTHTSGLPAEVPAGVDAADLQGWLEEALGRRPPDARVLYSDVGYWLLGRHLCMFYDCSLEEAFEAHARIVGADPTQLSFGSAPVGQCVPAGPVEGSRQLVHDPFARRDGGTAGHAGAFGTLAGVVRMLAPWLDRSWLPIGLSHEAVTCQTHMTPGGHRSLAWTMAGDPYHPVAHDWPTTSLAHTGYTGVSAVVDPVATWWAVLLTNAVPEGGDSMPVLVARRHFHALVAQHLSELESSSH